MIPNNYTLGMSISIPQVVVPTPFQEDVLPKKAQEDEG